HPDDDALRQHRHLQARAGYRRHRVSTKVKRLPRRRRRAVAVAGFAQGHHASNEPLTPSAQRPTPIANTSAHSPARSSFLIPCPGTRSRFPLGVPGGIRIVTFFPSSVFTLIFEPNVACAMLIFTGATTSSPSRRKNRSVST